MAKLLIFILGFSFFLSFFWQYWVLTSGQTLYHLSHSASPDLYWVFLRYGLVNYLPVLALNRESPDLCLLSN
jgi:hypothetical protein